MPRSAVPTWTLAASLIVLCKFSLGGQKLIASDHPHVYPRYAAVTDTDSYRDPIRYDLALPSSEFGDYAERSTGVRPSTDRGNPWMKAIAIARLRRESYPYDCPDPPEWRIQ